MTTFLTIGLTIVIMLTLFGISSLDGDTSDDKSGRIIASLGLILFSVLLTLIVTKWFTF